MRRHFGIKKLLGLTTIICLALGAWAMSGAILWWWVSGPKSIGSPADWPHHLRELAKGLSDNERESIRVRHLGGFIDNAYIWRVVVEPGQRDQILQKLSWQPLEPLPDDHPLPDIFKSRQPSWWATKPQAAPRQYKTKQFEVDQRGADGDHFFAVYSERSGLLRVWCKLNF